MKKITSKFGMPLKIMAALPILALFCMMTSVSFAQTSDVEITITTDSFGNETSWDLRETSGPVIASDAALPSNTTVVENVAVPCNQTTDFYEFNIYDSFGDGGPTYMVTEDGNLVASGTLAGSVASHQFETACAPPACALDNPQPIDDFTPVTSTITVTGAGVIGAMTDQNTFSQLDVEAQHDAAADMVITLTSPMGTVHELSSNNGGTDGLDIQDIVKFVDGQPNITTWAGGPPAVTGYEAEAGSLMSAFAGEPIAGDWTLTILDGGVGDEGTLVNFCLEFTNNGVVGTPPSISCPIDLVIDSEPGVCTTNVTFANAAAIDDEDGDLSGDVVQTAGLPSGSDFPVGVNTVTFEVTDSDGNTVDCSFTITVQDNEDPVAVCSDFTVTLDAAGMGSITVDDIDGGSTDNCPMWTLSASQLDFDCGDVGDNTVTLTVTDASGNTATCDATVTVVDDIAPVIECEGAAGSATYSTTSGAAINNTLPPAVSVLNVTDDVSLSDVDVDIQITHTWVSDMTITLESPAGTVVTLYSQANNVSCSQNDIDATWNDDAAVLADDTCNGSAPAISGEVAPSVGSALADFNGESSLGDWTLTVTDGVGGDAGTLDTWSLIISSPDLAATPLDVTLDANGMATVDAEDLLVSFDDACGAFVTVGSGATPTTLTTLFDGGNGSTGNMFDINALNDVTINSFDVSIDDGETLTVEVWYRDGTHVGFTTSNAGWTMLASTTVTSAGENVPTPLNLNLGQTILAGDTGAFYVTGTTGFEFNYTNGTTTGAVFASDSNIEFLEGSGGGYFNVTFNPRVFNGNILYTEGLPAATTIDFDCSNVGSNTVVVTVTDPSGNASTCEATVNVIDDTAPVVVCQDVDIEIGEDGTAVLDPTTLIDMTSSVEACGYDIVTADITDFDCDDIGTPVLVTIFVADPSGNIASCSAMVTAVDVMGPSITCPDDVNVAPDATGVYTMEDYLPMATIVDNCSDPVSNVTQDPAAGTALGVGVYTVTISAEDDFGNVGTCTFELTVDPITGVEESELSTAIAIYPNPADGQVTISNKSSISLETAAIFDVNGKLVNTINLTDMQAEKTIDVSALASGVYMVQITGENAVTVKRLIKK